MTTQFFQKMVEYYESPEFENIFFGGIMQVILDQAVDTDQMLTMEIDRAHDDISDLLNTAFISDYCGLCYKITCICDCEAQYDDSDGEMMVESIDFAVCSKCFEEDVMFECDMCHGIPKTNFQEQSEHMEECV